MSGPGQGNWRCIVAMYFLCENEQSNFVRSAETYQVQLVREVVMVRRVREEGDEVLDVYIYI